MNTRLVNTAAGVINAALTQNRTAAGIAMALESAQMLMTPEVAAELVELRARVVELEELLATAPLPVTLTAKADVADGITRRFAPTQALREDVTPQVRKLRDLLAGQSAAVESGGVS